MKELIITKIKPQFTTVITTLDVYEDNLIVDGVLRAPKGFLKLYQRVVAVGPNVHHIKEGDLVLLNLQNYVIKKYKENSLNNDMSEREEEYVYDFPKILINNEVYGKFQDRDIDGIIEDFVEKEIEESTGNGLFEN